MRGARWSMLLSHHAPCDYDRTWRVAGAHVCVRCLGVAIGGVCAAGATIRSEALPLALTLGLAVPALLDYACHELGRNRSSNARRLGSGLLFGCFVAALAVAIARSNWLLALLLAGWFGLLQLLVTLALARSGRLEEILVRYEQAVYEPLTTAVVASDRSTHDTEQTANSWAPPLEIQS